MSNTLKRMLFNDGEAIEFKDFNDMQKYLNCYIADMLLGHQCKTTITEQLLDVTSVFSVGVGGCITSTSIMEDPMSFHNAPGLIGYCDDPAIDGSDAKFKWYYLQADELQLTLENGSAQPRYDILQVKIVDGVLAGQEVRDFEDGITHAITSQSLYKQYGTTLAFSIKKGTPAGSPSIPTPDAGYRELAHFYIDTSYSGNLDGYISDVHIPMGLKEDFRFASMYGVFKWGGAPKWNFGSIGREVNGFLQHSGSDDEPVVFMCPANCNQRVLGLEVHGNSDVCVTMRLIRMYEGHTNSASGAYDPPLMYADMLAEIYDGPLTDSQTFDLSAYNFWGSAATIGLTTGQHLILVIIQQNGSTFGTTIDSIKWTYSG